ncbi:MAG: hypothetical protein IBJ15_19615 [Alphaproteobacteria bacterium]|nr:hypothetical protein [Alphaproteobacteria bacterium]
MEWSTFITGTWAWRALVDAAPLPIFWNTVEAPSICFFDRTVLRSLEPSR